MLESNKKRSERKKREAALRKIIEDRFVPYSVPFEDEYIAPNVILTPTGLTTENETPDTSMSPDTTIGILIAIVMMIILLII
jgi:hypothetical protein